MGQTEHKIDIQVGKSRSPSGVDGSLCFGAVVKPSKMQETVVIKTLDAKTKAIDAGLTIAAQSSLVCTIRVGFKRDLSVCLNGGYSIDGFEQTIQ